ncbi:VCBS repeat-containing protein [Sulfidibacter corallicola]|uniref:VCBS repeat-containing protein n=1 Tax=Sulfidibacter corallicola TaxID=2818388 RepID=A0A8A4TKY2_SULCO|nr:CARDB domain-containing protein [Sulfidibacter corallicola]QTD50616.1 VCBS repeat-containing protein [Sulfidibacter corallicola]
MFFPSLRSFSIRCLIGQLLLLFPLCTAIAQSSGLPFTNATQQLPLIPDLFGNPVPAFSPIPMAVVDMNQDDLDDIIRLHDGRKLTITRQTKNGFSSDQTTVTLSFFPWAIAVADVDSDGLMDIYVGGNGNEVALLLGSENWDPQLPHIQANPSTGSFFSQGANFVDIDGDGVLDLFACGDTTENLTWKGQIGGIPTSQDLIPQSNPGTSLSVLGGNYGSVWTDIDDDGDLDMHLAKCKAGASSGDIRRTNMMLVQQAPGSYLNLGITYRLDDNSQSWALDFGDIDNDGILEAIVLNHTGDGSNPIASLLVRNDQNRYVRVLSTVSKLSYLDNGAQVAMRDFDNDGLLDVVIAGNSSEFFRNIGNRQFERVGHFDFGDGLNMATFAIGDLNDDGFLDIYGGYVDFVTGGGISNSADPDRPDQLWLNNYNNGNKYLKVRLKGKNGNRQAVGARVSLTSTQATKGEANAFEGESGTAVTQMREVRAGESYGIANSFDQHFGLGAAPSDIGVAVRWPKVGANPPTTFALGNVAPNQTIQITQDVKPDLHVADSSLGLSPSAPGPGDSASLSFTVRNLTATHAGSQWTRAYLSSDAVYQAGDPQIGSSLVGNVSASGSLAAALTVTIPGDTDPGDYFILLRTDVLGEIDEANENNNTAALAVAIGNLQADLVVRNASVSPTTLTAGSSLTATADVVNEGGAAAGSSTLGYYLSTDQIWDQADQQLATDSVSSLAVDGSSHESALLGIPSGITGPRYILFRADMHDQVSEGPGEDNNVVARPITVLADTTDLPDLVVSFASGSPSTILAGERIYTHSRVENQGTLYSGNSVMGIYYSQDATWDAADTLLHARTVGGLHPGDTSYDPEYVTISGGTPGTRYLLFVADIHNQRVESNEGNNVTSVAFTLIDPAGLPDLVTRNGRVSHGSVKPGDWFWSYVRVSNQGVSSSHAASTFTKVWLSTDSTLNPSVDTSLTSIRTDPITGNQYHDLSQLTRLPAATTPGNYYLIFEANATGSIDETNHDNNTSAISITVLQPTNFPDYIVENASLDASSVQAGGSVDTSCRLRNVGTGTTTPSKFKYFLSDDASYSAGDVLLRTVNVGDIGFPPTYGYPVTIPAGTPSGTRYILFFTDADNDIIENDENNNVEAIAITVN